MHDFATTITAQNGKAVHGVFENAEEGKKADSTDSQDDASTIEEPVTRSARWSDLFAFTTRTHAIILSCAIAGSITSGALVPIFSIFVGKIFDSFTDFGGGTIDGAGIRHIVSRNCIYLAVLGGVTWLLNGSLFFLWLTFGELQAKTCRTTIFDQLLDKAVGWYDTRTSGIGAIVPRINT